VRPRRLKNGSLDKGRQPTGRLIDDVERSPGHDRDYLGLLAERGLLRDDLGVDDLGYAYQATFEGFLRAAPLEQRADLLARTVQRAFEREKASSTATVRDLATATVNLLGDLISTDREASGVPGA
jgi:hypothetical protein